MKKILTVVGARPQFIKAAMFSRAVAKEPLFKEILVHTGQHYDDNMSRIFFEELDISTPGYLLKSGNGTHAKMTGSMMIELERIMVDESPDAVLVYGDTNSTLAAALTASKLHMPVIHAEAGLRSFNRNMPEEINRILTDHVSEMLFVPTFTAVDNLKKEGIVSGVYKTGDIMFDAAKTFAGYAEENSTIRQDLNLRKPYILATVHRQENTDNMERLQGIFTALQHLTYEYDVVVPLHPRTGNVLAQNRMESLLTGLKRIPPLSFFDMISLEKHAQCIVTDSGGVQKEAYFHGTPCVTVRNETEWVETVSAGWNNLCGADSEKICRAVRSAKSGQNIPEFGDGHAAEEFLSIIRENLR